MYVGITAKKIIKRHFIRRMILKKSFSFHCKSSSSNVLTKRHHTEVSGKANACLYILIYTKEISRWNYRSLPNDLATRKNRLYAVKCCTYEATIHRKNETKVFVVRIIQKKPPKMWKRKHLRNSRCKMFFF